MKKQVIIVLLFIFGNSAQPAKNISNAVRGNVKKRLKILFILDKFPWYTKAIIVNQIAALMQNGHEVDIYARTAKQSTHIDQAVYDLGLLERTYRETLPPNMNKYDLFVCQYGSEGKRFVKIIDQLKLPGKLVTCIRGGDITSKVEIKPGLYDRLFERCNLFLPVCYFFKYKLQFMGCASNKIRVMHSAINLNHFKFKKRLPPKKGKPVHIISVNRLYEEKANDVVIQAVVELLHEGYNIVYDIVGDGPERNNLQKLIDKYDVNKQVRLLGWRNQQGVAEVLQTGHLFILPSTVAIRGASEGIPNALKEAMACGMPVIGTYHGGNAELIEDDITGFLVPERNVKALKERIKYLIQNPKRWAAIGKAGRKKILREFEQDKVNKRFVRFLEQLTGISKRTYYD